MNTIENHIEALGQLFDLSATSGRAYEGETEGDVPVLVTILEIDPPSVMVRIAINRSRFPFELQHVPEQAQPTIASGKLNYEAREFYCTISAYDLSETTPEEFAAIIRESVDLLEGLGLFKAKGCDRCSKPFDSAAEYFGNNRVCPDCARRRQEIRQKAEAELNKPKPALAALIPLAVAFAAAGWMGLWVGYEYVFFSAGSDAIVVPWVVIILILIGIGLLFGYPMGKLVRRSGLLEKFPEERFSLGLVALSVILGEVLFTWIVFRKNGVPFSLRGIWAFWSSYGLMYGFTKLLVAGAIYLASQKATAPRKLSN